MRVLVRCRGTTAPTSDALRADVAAVARAAAARTQARHFAGGVARTTWTLPGRSRLGYVEYEHQPDLHVIRILPADAEAAVPDIVLEERVLDTVGDDPETVLDGMTARWTSYAGAARDAGGTDIYEATKASERRISEYLRAACAGSSGSWAYGAATMHKPAWAMIMGAKNQPHVEGLRDILESCSDLDGDLVVASCRQNSATRRWIIEDACSNAVSIDGRGDVVTAMRMLAAIRSSGVKAA